MSPDVLVRGVQQSSITPADPLSLAVARRWMGERPNARNWANFSQWSRESRWLALNRSIARGDMSVRRVRVSCVSLRTTLM
jgi:hypothetical protein